MLHSTEENFQLDLSFAVTALGMCQAKPLNARRIWKDEGPFDGTKKGFSVHVDIDKVAVFLDYIERNDKIELLLQLDTN